MPAGRRAWVFDLDGTLAVAQHDFDGMKRRLGLDMALPLLEAVEALPEPERTEAWAAVSAWELEHAGHAVPAPGLHGLLDALTAAGCRLGILTRNRVDVAWATLEAIDATGYFEPATVLGRDCVAPKPDPAGVNRLLRAWQARPTDAVMVGDSVHDVGTARNAMVLGVLVGPSPSADARALADRVVPDLTALQDAWAWE